MELLDWLPQHPNLAEAISAARRHSDPVDRLHGAVRLANYRRDLVATERIDRLAGSCLGGIGASELAALELTPLRIAVLASHSVEHLAPAIRVAGLQRRLALNLHIAPYGLYRQVILDQGASELASFAPQAVLLAIDACDAPMNVPLDASEADVAAAVAARIEELRHLWRCAKERFGAEVIQQTLIQADPPLFGFYEALVPASPTMLVERLNRAIRSAARDDGVLLLDLAWHTARNGECLTDPVRWHHAKQLVSPAHAPLYGDLVARIAAAIVGLSRKCLVLDLDNTLWGGVVGDEGVENIRLGQGSAEGEAFLAFQRYASRLGQRGIILAVCSKNDPRVAEAAFARPEKALRREDIAAFVANWEDKAANLRTIARMLNIALDSMVFVDDNPAERYIIRRELPQVAVPELPDDVAHYPARLADAGYFEPVSFTKDDAARARSYRLNAARRAELEGATDLDGYLRSLAMTMSASPISAADLPRVTQLINKTNQFNLTTRRYTEAEVNRVLATPGTVGLSFRLSDRFGDNGLISVIIARPDDAGDPGNWLIDTWLMSCRVLGRQVEVAALEVLAAEAAQHGAKHLVGIYLPTKRNGLVADHYAKLGFTQAPSRPDIEETGSVWQFDLAIGRISPHFINVEMRHERSGNVRRSDQPVSASV